MPKPLTAKEGTVEVFGIGDPGVSVISSSDAAAAIQKGTLQASELGKQTLTQPGGWFTKTNSSGITSDRLVTDTINDAYKARLDGFGENAKRMFNDIKSKAMEMDTYLNDEQIGSFVENNAAAKNYTNEIMEYAGDMDYVGTGTGKYQIKTEIPNLGQTGDYSMGTTLPGQATEYTFNGAETFGKQEATQGFFSRNKSKIGDIAKGLLAPSPETPQPVAPFPTSSSYGMTNFNANYGGTDIRGSGGGELVAKVYGDAAANNIKNYYKNMNLLNNGEVYI
jgi:hypothetical protein